MILHHLEEELVSLRHEKGWDLNTRVLESAKTCHFVSLCLLSPLTCSATILFRPNSHLLVANFGACRKDLGRGQIVGEEVTGGTAAHKRAHQ